MPKAQLPHLIKHTPFRILLPSLLMILLFGGSVFFYMVPSFENRSMEQKKEMIYELTGAVVSTLYHYNSMVERGDLTLKEAQSRAIEMVRDMRYGPLGKDYFWINDMSPTMIMHPFRADLEGHDLSLYKDMRGTPVFSLFVETVRKQKSGFIDYYWQWKDHPDRIAKKISYIRMFEPWGWVIGTGFYLDDVKADVESSRDMLVGFFIVLLLLILLIEYYILHQSALSEKKKLKVMNQRERLVRALQEGEERYRTIADFAFDWEIWISVDGVVKYCSPSCQRITGHAPETFFERPSLVRDIIMTDDRQSWDSYVENLAGGESGLLDFRILTRDDDIRWLNVSGRSVSGIGMKPLGIRLSFRDITDRKQMEEQLRHQALHDPLTGLANRTLCLDRINQAMQRASRRDQYYFSVVFLDLDRFKVINDSLGHRFGDLVLAETAVRLKEHVRTLDTVSRFGGDEFVLLLDELSSPGEALRIVKRIREALACPFSFNENEVQTTASFGIVLSPPRDVKAAEILQRANIAMHHAKDSGRNKFKVFTSRMFESAVDQLTLENDLRRGLETGEFHLEYQPIMGIGGTDLVGFEALARWNHPERGAIPPTEFIPAAEESGVIMQLGEWVLREALGEFARWRTVVPGSDNLYMSVNLSSKQFARTELDRVVLDALKESGLPAAALKLEITESTILDYPDAAVRIIKKLRSHGVLFSIDDFGTGYSSLSQLQQLPVDTLKVDRSFITRLKADPENMEIVKAIIALAHSLELNVVAEGVEDASQLCALIELSCENVQGFYFHKPMKSAEAVVLLQHRAAADENSPQSIIAQARSACKKQS